ncbi:MAG: endonuclease III [Clostridia bacterium]|nr:endonuclease III [Clostridia bacterium]
MTVIDAERVLDALEDLYPEARAELHFSNPYETLVATILSAQCTDKRVNQVTEQLFVRYPNVESMARASIEELEPQIKSCGLYHNKAKNIIAACQAIVADYHSVVPSDRKELMSLPGVGQKTAGVVLLAAFGEDQIPVDTHVFRVSNRIGLVHASTPIETERQLRAILPRERWSHGHHLIIWHGRRCCAARKPACDRCPLSDSLCEKNNVKD